MNNISGSVIDPDYFSKITWDIYCELIDFKISVTIDEFDNNKWYCNLKCSDDCGKEAIVSYLNNALSNYDKSSFKIITTKNNRIIC